MIFKTNKLVLSIFILDFLCILTSANIVWNTPQQLITASDADTNIAITSNLCTGEIISIFQHNGIPNTLYIQSSNSPSNEWISSPVTSILGAPEDVNLDWDNPTYRNYHHNPDLDVNSSTNTWLMIFSTRNYIVISKYNVTNSGWEYVTHYYMQVTGESTIKSDGRGTWMAAWYDYLSQQMQIITSTDDGLTWTNPNTLDVLTAEYPSFLPIPVEDQDTNPEPTKWLLFFTHQDPSILPVGVLEEAVATSIDGEIWSSPSTNTPNTFDSISLNSDTFVYMKTPVAARLGKIVSITINGTFIESTDDGATWNNVIKTSPYFSSIIYGGGDYWGYAGGQYNLNVGYSDDNSETWNGSLLETYSEGGYPVVLTVDSEGKWIVMYRRNTTIEIAMSISTTRELGKRICYSSDPIYLNITDKCVNHINDEESCDLESNEIVNVNDPTIINKTVVLKTGSTLIISNNLTIVENLTVSDGSTIEISTKSNDFTTISIGGCFTPKGELIITNDFTNNELIEDTVIDLFEYQCLSSNSTFNNVTIRDPNDPDKLIIIDDMDKDECISIEYTQSVMQLLMVGCNVDNNNNNNVTEVDSVTMVMIYIIGCMFLVIIGVTISMYFCRKRIFPYRYRATFKLDETEIPTSG